MPTHARGRRGRRKKSRSTKPPPLILPKAIRDELRMSVALQGYSSLREGLGKTLHQQYTAMEQFFHGSPGKAPSQIQMMAEGVGRYKDFFEKQKKPITSRKKSSKKNQALKYYLKTSLSRDDSRLFIQGVDITHRDLEKK